MDDTVRGAATKASASSKAANPPSAAGTKRKRESKTSTKFYAVRIGHSPGVYYSWADCLEQVNGFPRAMFKSFTNLGDAEAYVAGRYVNPSNGGVGLGSKQCYGVLSGRRPGVYATWPEVLEQITGWRKPQYRGFSTWTEAEAYVAKGLTEEPAQAQDKSNAKAGPSSKAKASSKGKKANTTVNAMPTQGVSANAEDEQGEYEAGTGPLPPEASDSCDPTITLDPSTGTARYKTAKELSAEKYQAVSAVPYAPIKIHTDGSALGNGRAGAIAGVGVYFGPRDRRNISEPLSGTRQTNQRAELTAIIRALDVAPRDKRVLIISDSQYAINCVTEWCISWKRNGWVTNTRKPVENKDLVVKIVDLLEERKRLNSRRAKQRRKTNGDVKHGGERDGDEEAEEDTDEDEKAWAIWGIEPEKLGPWAKGRGGVQFQWVKGHGEDEGNNAADRLAVEGAEMAKALSAEVILD